MGRPTVIPAEPKARIVMGVLAGETTMAQDARSEKVSEQSIDRWKADFLEAGKTASATGRSGPSTREQQGDPGRGGHVDREALPDDRHAERTWRRWQARARAGGQPKGPWPTPARGEAWGLALTHATKHSAWGHRKIWAMVRHEGHVVSEATVLRTLRDEGLILPAHYQRERRKLAELGKAAFAKEPTGPNEGWQLDFSEFETTTGGTMADMAAGGLSELLVQVRASLPRVRDGEPVRRDRTRPGQLRGHVRPPAQRPVRHRRRDRADQTGRHDRHR